VQIQDLPHQQQSYPQYSTETIFVNKIKEQHKQFTDDEIPNLIADYKTGLTIYELADKYHCHRNTVSRALKAHGVTVTIQKITTDDEIQNLLNLRKNGLTNQQIAEHLNISKTTVKRYFRINRDSRPNL
jgi:response regulator of citrate/malate metabolism